LFGALCGDMGAEHSGRVFHLNIRWLMMQDAGENCPRNDISALLKKNSIIPLPNDSSTTSGLPNSYSSVICYTFESAEQLHARKI